ncbi:cohesin complex subunit [Thecaphora frezii]
MVADDASSGSASRPTETSASTPPSASVSAPAPHFDFNSDGSLTDLSDEEDAPPAVQEGEDDEEDDEPDIEEPSSDDEDGDDDYGGGSRRKKAKKTPAKAKRAQVSAKKPARAAPKTPQVKRSKAASSSKAAGASVPKTRSVGRTRATSTKSRGAGTKDELPINDDNEIFNTVKDSNSALQSTAEDWVFSFQKDQGKALAKLINFVIRTCGCNGSVDENQVVDIDNIVDTLEELQEAFKRQTLPSYPIVSKSKSFKSFRRSLGEFLRRLILSAYEAEILTVDGFMEAFQAWVSAMSSSSLRYFRHTATVVALWTITAINEVNALATKDLATATKQRDAERKKARGDKSRLKELETKVEEAKRLKKKLDDYVDEFMNSVFVHRYRDYDAGIRTECVEELGSWMRKHPAQYLQGTYFRYVGWVLSDADAGVRMAAIRAMTGLYTRDQFVGSIRHFTEMFKGRLVQMATGDVDLSVRIATISVLVLIDRHDLLDEEQRDSLATHIFDVEPKVRTAVASFVASILEDEVRERSEALGGRSAAAKKPANRQDESSAEVAKLRLKCLASLLVKYGHRLDTADPSTGDLDADEGDPTSASIQKQAEDLKTMIDGAKEGRVGMAIEALWDAVEEIQEWQPLIDLLLLDHSHRGEQGSANGSGGSTSAKGGDQNLAPESYRLDAEEEAVLVEALVSILRKTYEHAALIKDDDDTSKRDMTRAMMPALPKLLAKYRTDAPRISDLLVIPEVLDLEMYTEMRETNAYEALWDDVSAQIQRHVEPLLLKHAVQAIRKMMATTSLSNTNSTKLVALQESLLSALQETAQNRDVETAVFTEDEVHLLGANILRMHMLSQVCDMTEVLEDDERGQSTSGWEIILGLAGRGRLGYREEEKMVQGTIQVLTLHIMWKTRLSMSYDAAHQGPAIDALASKRSIILDLLNEYVAGTHSNVCAGVQRVAFERLLMIHMMYAALPVGHEDGAAADTASEAPAAHGSARLPAALRLVCTDETQYRCAGFIQAEIERYIEHTGVREKETRSKAAQNEDAIESDEENGAKPNSDDEDDHDEDDPERTPRASKAPARGSRVGSRKASKAAKTWSKDTNVERPSRSLLEAEHAFCSTISTFVSAIRVGVVDAKHSTSVLVQYGRLGAIYDSCCKVLIEVLKEEAIFVGYSRAVVIENTLWDALKESFEIYLDDGEEASEARFVSLSRQAANALVVRGGGFTAIKAIDPRCLISLHNRASEYVAQRVAAAERSGNKGLRSRMPMMYKGMAHLLMNASPTDAVKIKSAMDRAYRAANVEVPPSAKAWEPQRSYERRLLKIAAKSNMFAKANGDQRQVPQTPGGATASVHGDIDSGSDLTDVEVEDEDMDRGMADRGSPVPLQGSKRPREASTANGHGEDEGENGDRVENGDGSGVEGDGDGEIAALSDDAASTSSLGRVAGRVKRRKVSKVTPHWH